jgi:hypothetical protein
VPNAFSNGTTVASLNAEGRMELLILSAALAGSLGAAWAIQRTLLTVCLRAIDPHRR